MNTGILCSLTDAKPDFEGQCADYDMDETEVKQKIEAQQVENARGHTAEEDEGSLFGSSAIIGVLMILGGLIWLFLGLQGGRLFFYPIGLVIWGVVRIFKGMSR